MNHEHSVAGHFAGEFDEAKLQSWAAQLRSRLSAPRVSLGLVFMTPHFFSVTPQVLELIRVHAQIPLLAGCSGAGLISGGRELEDEPGISLALYALPGVELKATRFTQQQVQEAGAPGYWHQHSQVSADQVNGWLAFADPFHLDCEAWVRGWNAAYPLQPIYGGLASGDFNTQQTQVYLNGDVFEEGGVALAVGGNVALQGVLSQGCTPIGDTWTITRTERNFIQEIGNRPAYTMLAETFNRLPPAEQKKSQGNLFIGLVVNEYVEDYHRGDFLVRNLLGADPQSGVLAVGALPRLGQTIQFQRRDAEAADEDMRELLGRAKVNLAGTTIYGGCLCSCNGRGAGLFGKPDHDAALVQETLGPMGVAGFFCNGEIGPIGDRVFLHGYTASLALFVAKPQVASRTPD